MNRFLKIVMHSVIILLGAAAAGYSDFWDWGLLRGMVLPVLATFFFIYLVLFLVLGGDRVFRTSA